MQELRSQDFDRSESPDALRAGRQVVPAPPVSRAFDRHDRTAWRASLGRVIETEILPRLFLAHSGRDRSVDPAPGDPQDELDLGDFARLLFAPGCERAREYLENHTRAGARETLLLDVLAPAARRLGQLWESDDCDFVEVTVGLRRLHALMRDLAPDFDDVDHGVNDESRVLFLAAPGEKHIFGMTMVERFFRAAGWRTRLTDMTQYLDDLRREWFEIVGFSLSCTRHVPALAAAVGQARAASSNPSILVLVGGPIFIDAPELAREVGADATARDAAGAVQLARSLLDGRKRL
jgi:methanogenic corrinoid protein MtbC1